MLDLPESHQVVRLWTDEIDRRAYETDKAVEVLHVIAHAQWMIEVILNCQWASWVKVSHLLWLTLILRHAHLISLNQVLKAVLKQVKQPAKHIVRCLQSTDQLRLASFLLVENLTVLNRREVQILVKVSGPDGSLFALSQDIDEEGDDAEEATLLLKELNVALRQIPPEPLQRVL